MRELRRLREKRGLTQAELAAASGVDRATINQVERGARQPTLTSLRKIALALGAELGDFFPKAQLPLFAPEHDPTGRRPGPARRTWADTYGTIGRGEAGTAARAPGTGEAQIVALPIGEAEIRRLVEPVERGETTAAEAAHALARAMRDAMSGGQGPAPAT